MGITNTCELGWDELVAKFGSSANQDEVLAKMEEFAIQAEVPLYWDVLQCFCYKRGDPRKEIAREIYRALVGRSQRRDLSSDFEEIRRIRREKERAKKDHEKTCECGGLCKVCTCGE